LIVAATAVTAALGLSSCGPDYTYFRIHVTSATPRNDIEECRMDIASERGPVVASYPLETIAGGTDQSTGLLLPNKQGCANGMAPANVGNFHYSTSRTSGSLTFTVNAYDSNGKVVETKISDPMAIPCPAGLVESGECKVELPMARVPTP
jgi:hypothetical protein